MNSKLKTEITVPKYTLPNDFQAIADQCMPFTQEEALGTYCSTWRINNWSDLENRVKGPVFETEGLKWSLLLFPNGNNQNDVVSTYLELSSSLEEDCQEDFHACAQFLICISNPDDPSCYITHAAQHRFSKLEADWGFTGFISHKELKEGINDKPGFLVNDTVVLTTIVRLIKDQTGVLWHNFINYDSKKTTGYVGLHNQGATCYMNSLFQSLYFTNYFRLAVYQIPTDNDEPCNSIALALQRLFFNLQFSNYAVSTTEVTRSFGWNTVDAFMQRDVQEFNRLLQDNLERKMKGTPAEDSIKRLFVGKMKSYIKCINVEYESSRSEDYYDIQLNVKNCKNLEESFRNYIEVETLEGENKYMAEGYGLQDAKKGVIFESFPPVLHLQLKRFEYDMMRDAMFKINDRHEFPPVIDLEPYLSDTANRSTSHRYALHGVLVHTGDSSGGHYFAFVRPTIEDKWFRFDDDRVTPALLREVLEDNYGGEMLNTHPKLRNVKRSTNAYMLVYIRESMREEILKEVTIDDIPDHLMERFKKEQIEIELINKQRSEQHLYTKAYIVGENHFYMNTGPDFVQVFEDDKDSSRTAAIRTVRKDMTLKMFIEEIAKELNTSSDCFRFWILLNRENQTVRLGIALEQTEENFTLEEIRQANHPEYPYLRLYLEAATIDPLTGLPLFHDTNADDILIFIKLFDQGSQTLRGIGKLYINVDHPIYSIEDAVNEMCGFERGTPLNIYEVPIEVDNETIELVDRNDTFDEHDVYSGDIFCVERQLTPEQIKILKNGYASINVADYLISLQRRVLITFVPRNNYADDFDLILRTDMQYSEIVYRLGKFINCNPLNLRLMTPDIYGNPRSTVHPIEDLTLWDIIQTMPNTGDSWRLFFDVLTMSLSEFEKKKLVKLNICYPKLNQVNYTEFIVRKNAQLLDINAELQDKLEVTGQEIRFFTVENHKLKEDLSLNQIVPEDTLIYAELVPQEELKKGEEDFYISVYHYQRDLAKTHSVPFRFLVIKDEPFKDTKKRLQERTGLEDKEWNKVKFNIVSKFISNIKEDEYVLSDHKFTKDEALGLDHYDTTQQQYSEKGLFIKE
ncbi:hypothetical protein G6F43_004949 [Rhizopus delemar]|nr:hypothetical protein G6F43_004949 [Rhizopus delemar]